MNLLKARAQLKLLKKLKKVINMQLIIKNEFNAHLNSSQKTLENIGINIEIAANICVDSLKKGNKILRHYVFVRFMLTKHSDARAYLKPL